MIVVAIIGILAVSCLLTKTTPYAPVVPELILGAAVQKSCITETVQTNPAGLSDVASACSIATTQKLGCCCGASLIVASGGVGAIGVVNVC